MSTVAAGADVNHSYALVSPEARWAQNQLVVAGPPRFDEAPTIIRTVEMRERPFSSSFQQLDSFAALGADWDSYGATTIAGAALSTARALLSDLSLRPGAFGSTSLVPFSVAPVATGGVKLEWHRASAALELWIEPDGRIVFLLDRPSSENRFEEKALPSIPAAIAEVLAFAA